MLAELEQRRFGLRTGIYRIADLFKSFQLPATFFIPSAVMEAAPSMVEYVAGCGFELGAHGYLHELLDEVPKEEVEQIFDRMEVVFERLVGRRPVGYRSPAWEMTPHVLSLLRRRGYTYDSSLMGAEHPYSMGGLVEIPVQWFSDDVPFFRHVRGDVRPLESTETVLRHWLDQFDALHVAGGMFVLTLHPWVSGHAMRVEMVRRLLDHIMQHSDVWVATAQQLADWHLSSADRNAFQVEVGEATVP